MQPPYEISRPKPWQSARYTLAERVACATLDELGYRDPEAHPAYGRVLGSVQQHLDGAVNAIASVAFHDGRRKSAELQDELLALQSRFRRAIVLAWLAVVVSCAIPIMSAVVACLMAPSRSPAPAWLEREMGPGVPRPVLPPRDR